MLNIVLLGLPGCGKGTQSQMLNNCKEFNFLPLSSGSVLRSSRYSKLLSSGDLISDDIVVNLTFEHLDNFYSEAKHTGVVFDGFPRTKPQASILGEKIKIDIVINIETDEQIVIDRVCSRKICSSCDRIYNEKTLIESGLSLEKCSYCNSDLCLRKDDTVDVIKKRILIAKQNNQGLLEYYSSQEGCLVFNINGSEAPEKIHKAIIGLLKKYCYKGSV